MTAEKFLKEKLIDGLAKRVAIKDILMRKSDLIDFAEAYASHVLQEYKKDLAEWSENQNRKATNPHIIWKEDLLTKLKEE